MRHSGRTVEHELGRMAARSYGVITRQQLLRAGIGREQITRRLRSGVLLREYPGVYRVGHRAPSVEASYLAAVWACGEGALLYGRAAGQLWALVKGAFSPPEVTSPREQQLRGIATRRSRGLRVEDGTIWRRIPITTVPYTVVALAGTLSAHELARSCHEAGVRYGITPAEIEAVLERLPTAPGAGTLRRVLRGDERVTLSTLERRFLARLSAAGLPLPEANRRAGGRLVDCRWPAHRLTVELDGYRYHRSRHAWEQDRQREREAYARGDDFRRYTYGDVVERPDPMLAELNALLGGKSPDWVSHSDN